MALKLSGLSWSARVGPNHIAANNRWAACGLPRSSNTVIEDIRSDIPLNRVERYANFFQVPAVLFADADVSPYSPAFSCEILRHRQLALKDTPSTQSFFDAVTMERVRKNNSTERNFHLYQLLAGVYDLYYRKDGAQHILRGCAVTRGQTEQSILVDGFMAFDEVTMRLAGTLFCWQNALHIQYHSEDSHILGYLMAPNPMQSFLLRNRQPFCLRFKGLSGSMTGAPEPESFVLCAVKSASALPGDIRDTYAHLCEEARTRTVLLPGDPEYAAILGFFSTPET